MTYDNITLLLIGMYKLEKLVSYYENTETYCKVLRMNYKIHFEMFLSRYTES